MWSTAPPSRGLGARPGDLVYRGFDVRDLVPGIPYESAVHLLLYGDPPSSDPSPEVVRSPTSDRTPPAAVVLRVVDSLPIRRCPARGAAHDPLRARGRRASATRPARTRDSASSRRPPSSSRGSSDGREGAQPVAPRPDLSHAANFLTMLTGERPRPARVRGARILPRPARRPRDERLDVRAPHRPSRPSRTSRAPRPAALATLKGPVHGGAPSRVSDMLDAVGSPDRAEAWIAEDGSPATRSCSGSATAPTRPTTRGRSCSTRSPGAVADPARFVLAEAVERSALAALRAAQPEGAPVHERRVLERGRARGGRAPPGSVHPDLRGGPDGRAGRLTPSSRRPTTGSSDRTSSTSGPAKGRQWPRPLAGRPDGRLTAALRLALLLARVLVDDLEVGVDRTRLRTPAEGCARGLASLVGRRRRVPPVGGGAAGLVELLARSRGAPWSARRSSRGAARRSRPSR